jgi:hypothetical protein
LDGIVYQWDEGLRWLENGDKTPARSTGTVEYRRQASFRLSRICRESPLTAQAGFFRHTLALSKPAHWYTVDAQGTGMEIPALDLAFGFLWPCAGR